MEIRDSIHGIIVINSEEVPIIESPAFQRLRQIKQLGFAENSFPGALHSRFAHSLGAMHTATQVFDRIFRPKSKTQIPSIPATTVDRWCSVLRLAALLHDIGHGPLSHTTEFAMPEVRHLNLPDSIPVSIPERKATHEDYTLKIILDSPLSPIMEKAGLSVGFKPIHVASLIEPSISIDDDFFIESIWNSEKNQPETIDFRPILRQIISSELDADRMDYLRRDSLYAGVSYGQFDFNWLLAHLTYHTDQGKSYLCLEHRALYAFEDFLLSRFHMFLMVYFHHKSVVFDEMLAQYLGSPDCDYRLPADIEDYISRTDPHLSNHLAQSRNPWAQRIVNKHPYRVLIELHSGIPASARSASRDKKLLQQITEDLQTRKIHSIHATSTSELSKYFLRPADPIFVRYDNHYQPTRHIRLNECTDLFEKYGEKRTLSRIYVAPEDYLSAKSSRYAELTPLTST